MLLHQRLDDVELVHLLGRDAIQFQALRELENLFPLRLILAAHHAVIHRLDAVLGQLLLDADDDLLGRRVTPLNVRLLLGEFLTRIKLDDLAAGLGGLLDRFEHTEPIERVGLGTDREAVLLEGIRNGIGSEVEGGGKRAGRETEMA